MLNLRSWRKFNGASLAASKIRRILRSRWPRTAPDPSLDIDGRMPHLCASEKATDDKWQAGDGKNRTFRRSRMSEDRNDRNPSVKIAPFYNEHTPTRLCPLRRAINWLADWVAQRFPNQNVQITPASADASFRRYFRLTWPDGSTRILMDAPPEKEDCKPFIHVAGLLAKADLAAPRILDKDLDNGFLVLDRPRPHRLPRRAERRPIAGRPADPSGARRAGQMATLVHRRHAAAL